MKNRNSYLHEGNIYTFQEVLEYFDLCIAKNSGTVSMMYEPRRKEITVFTESSTYVFKEL